jgi:hypothetical protein
MKRGGWRRRTLKTGGGLLGACVAYGALHLTLAYHPRPFFSHHRTYKNFTVHMREEIPPEITGILDRVGARLARSELNDEGLHHPIYIFNSDRLIRFLLFRDVHFGCNLPNGVSYITGGDVERDVARCSTLGPGDPRRRTLSETIAHEITHALIRRHVGWLGDRKLPSWVKEGYCEYVAEGRVIDDRTGLALMRNGASTPGFPQFRNRLMMEYLINERGLAIDRILRDPPDFATVEAEVLAGLRADEAGFLERLRTREP